MLEFSQQATDDSSSVGEVFKEFIRVVWMKFIRCVNTGGDSSGFGADGACAADVRGGVTDDPDGVSGDLFLQG